MCLRSGFPGWVICCGDGRGKKRNLVNLCLWDLMLLPGAVLKMPFHPGGPPYLPHLDFGERATCRQAGTLWICLFPSFPRGRPGEASSLYLLFKFSGCFSWVLICCLRDYPPSEFVFQTSSPDESRMTVFYYMCEGMWLRSPVLVSLHLFHSWTGLFFVMQGRGVNDTCPVVGNGVSRALFWGGRCVRWLTGAPPCGKPVPGSSLWSHMEQHDPSRFRHGAPCECFGLGVEFLTPSTLSWLVPLSGSVMKP